MELIGIGVIAAGFALWCAVPSFRRKKRRQEMGLDPERSKDWAWPPKEEAPEWSEVRYFNVRRRP
jgi:hypothetical protein